MKAINHPGQLLINADGVSRIPCRQYGLNDEDIHNNDCQDNADIE